MKNIIFIAIFFLLNTILVQAQIAPRFQLQMNGIDHLHASGFQGEGIRIAVLDNGFLKLTDVPDLQDISILDQWDFVENDGDVIGPCTGSCKHGLWVISTMASRLDGQVSGASPAADYMLYRTEDDRSETHAEEDFWIKAVQRADSLGVDIIISSLGYRYFDAGQGDYDISDLDGNSTPMSKAANIAAQHGILMICSAGNTGQSGNSSLASPADADSILSIGSVDEFGELSKFSSRGPTGDGRIKPDLMMLGEGVYYFNSRGKLSQGNGTSYSAPLAAGMAACLLQAARQKLPQASKQQLASRLKKCLLSTASQGLMPDNQLGYGLPDAERCYTCMTGEELPRKRIRDEQFGSQKVLFYPNPSHQMATLALRGIEGELTLEWVNISGKLISKKVLIRNSINYNSFTIQTPPQAGIYAVLLRDASGELLWSKNVVVR